MFSLEVTNPNTFRGRKVMETCKRDGELVVGIPRKTRGSGGFCDLKDISNVKTFMVAGH